MPVPDDVDDNEADGPNPITTAMVQFDGSSNAAYTIGFVPAGNYTGCVHL